MSVHNLIRGIEFVFIRHAESESNAEIHNGNIDNLTLFHDASLTACGIVQASQVSHYIEGKLKLRKLLKLFASPQQRAIDTCKDIKDTFSEEYQVEPDIYEYRCPDKQDLVHEHGTCKVDNTWEDFCTRVRAFIDKCETMTKDLSFQELSEKPVVLVFGHSLFISTFITMCCIQCKHYGPAGPEALAFHIPNASLSNLFYDTTTWSILHVGSTCHLTPELRIKHTNF